MEYIEIVGVSPAFIKPNTGSNMKAKKSVKKMAKKPAKKVAKKKK